VDGVIELVGVSKSFRHGASTKLLRTYISEFFVKSREAKFYALRDISLRVEDGESLAVVGRNGAGKSTLLSLVAGLTDPVEGTIAVKGRVAALLELGAGFHPDLTGVENLWLNASLLGLSRKRTEEVYSGVLSFADIGDFIDEPVRTYSAGMNMRLAFSIAIHCDPDILIVDEVLAVGDHEFQEKCRERIRGFRANGKTLLFVSHSGPLVRELCTRAVWLEKGRVQLDGPVERVLEAYAASEVVATAP
jgi:ABC-type polysaccharide/polyol phosphate transport system ATPase subunit